MNHIIIGAGRSGTTTLTEYLKQHKQVNNSIIKEVHYFTLNEHFEKGDKHFYSFFEKDNTIISTADTYAFTSKAAPKRIFEYNPNCKITLILRNPVERAFSNYNYAINNGHQSDKFSFLDCLEKDSSGQIESDIIKQNNGNHFYGGLYYQHINEWLQYFNREQLFICTTDQLKNEPQLLLQNWFNFLGISQQKIEVLSPANKATKVKSKRLQQFLLNRNNPFRKLARILPFKKLFFQSGIVSYLYKLNKKDNFISPKITEIEKQKAAAYFKEDLENLKKEFGISFT